MGIQRCEIQRYKAFQVKVIELALFAIFFLYAHWTSGQSPVAVAANKATTHLDFPKPLKRRFRPGTKDRGGLSRFESSIRYACVNSRILEVVVCGSCWNESEAKPPSAKAESRNQKDGPWIEVIQQF